MLEGLSCLKCGSADTLSLRFVDDTFCCSDCEEDTTIEEIEAVMSNWKKVLIWVQQAPLLPIVGD